MTTTNMKKKPNYRLRKRVRKTIASLLMITSLVIAAIPVDELSATSTEEVSKVNPVVDTTITYPDNLSNSGIQDSVTGNTSEAAWSYEIMESKDGSYAVQQVFKVDKSGVIVDYNEYYTSNSTTLTIPIKVNMDPYTKNAFSQTDIDTWWDSVDASKEAPYNTLLGFSDGDDGYYRKDSADGYWKNSLGNVISDTEIQRLYMDQVKGCKIVDEYEARYVDTDPGPGTTMGYIPYSLKNNMWSYNPDDTIDVMKIADHAFYDESKQVTKIAGFEKLEIIAPINAIGDSAFQGANTLRSINIGRAVAVGDAAFKGCILLSEVVIATGNNSIGVETFYGCSSLQSITLPETIKTIGAGAFAYCSNLKVANLGASKESGFTIGDFAFYSCSNLSSISFPQGLSEIGDGCFALETSSTNGLETISFHENPTSEVALGASLFVGQKGLKRVTMPVNFAMSKTVKLDENLFQGCSNLETVIFSNASVNADFPDNIFRDVEYGNFVVVGPPYLGNNLATPRLAAHAANVAYQYVENGVTYLEMKIEDNLYRIDQNGLLISFESANSSGDINLIVPSHIGDFKVTGIASECFIPVNEPDLKKRIVSIVIEDGSVERIEADTFKDCINLKTVKIGDSVNYIGDRAFANCPNVVKMEFSIPTTGAESFTIGNEAFKTQSTELTFVGEILPGFAPYEYAMDAATTLNNSGKRICYRSLAPSNLTVIYDNTTGLATLVDYPHFSNVDADNIEYKEELKDYFEGIIKSTVTDVTQQEEQISAMKDAVSSQYYIENKLRNEYTEEAPRGTGWTPADDPDASWSKVTETESALYDGITKIVVPAGVESIDAYNFYNATTGSDNNSANFSYVEDTDGGSERIKQYSAKPSTLTARTEEGVLSILGEPQLVAGSVSGITAGQDIYEHVPGGLFSGKFEEYDVGSVDERNQIGNDRIQSITMVDVTSIPSYAFASCEKLESVTLGDAVTKIGVAPFIGSDEVDTITGNAAFPVENKILYRNEADGGLTLIQCLPSRGLTVATEKTISSANDSLLSKVTKIEQESFIGTEGIQTVDLSDTTLKSVPKDAFYASKVSSVILPSSIGSIGSGAFLTDGSVSVTIPNKFTHIETDAFHKEISILPTIISYAEGTPYEYAKTNDLLFIPLGEKFKVTFWDNEGNVIEVKEVEAGGTAIPPEVTPPKGYVFSGWKGTYENVLSDQNVFAIFVADDGTGGGSGDGDGDGSGGSGGGSGDGDGDGSGGSGGGSGDGDGDGSGGSGGTDGDADGDGIPDYKVTVVSGSGSGQYEAGEIVNITANASADGKIFDKWTTSSSIYMANSENVTTSFVMPKSEVTVTATYKDGKDDSNDNDDDDSTGGNTGSNGGSTVITITKPGFSDKNVASAYVNGSADNFVVKITESATAQELMQKAFLSKMESLDTIKFFPMDISLYDSTGTVKVTDTAGLSVSITIPIPDELQKYAGNNKIACESNGKLEILDVKFTTINKVPCMTFVAKHFSPYAVYVDTDNLSSDSTLDENPKTGDGIHPKWFLTIGCFAGSMFLFLKKDRRRNTKLA